MCLKYRLRIEISYKGPSRYITGLYPHFSEYEQSCYRFPLQPRIALDACLHSPADETIVVGLLLVEVWGDHICRLAIGVGLRLLEIREATLCQCLLHS